MTHRNNLTQCIFSVFDILLFYHTRYCLFNFYLLIEIINNLKKKKNDLLE